MPTTTPNAPHPDGKHTHHTDRGYSSVTHYWDDGSHVTVARNDYAGTSIEYRPAGLRNRSIWWVERAELLDWLEQHRDRIPPHIWVWLAGELPDLKITTGSVKTRQIWLSAINDGTCPRCGSVDLTTWSQMSSGGEATGLICDDCEHIWGDGYPDADGLPHPAGQHEGANT